MPTENQWARATGKLVDMTNSGKLQWQAFPNLKGQREDIQGDAYVTVVQDRFIAVYEFRFKSYTDEDSWEFQNEVAVEFIELQGELQYRWPSTPKRWVLLDAVRCVVSGAPRFLDQFLADDDESGKR